MWIDTTKHGDMIGDGLKDSNLVIIYIKKGIFGFSTADCCKYSFFIAANFSNSNRLIRDLVQSI
jgi:hypothetical protein